MTSWPAPVDGALGLAVDIGTSAVRAFVYDSSGFGISGVRLRYEWTTTPDGGAEIDAERIVALVRMGVHGVITNDPRLFTAAVTGTEA